MATEKRSDLLLLGAFLFAAAAGISWFLDLPALLTVINFAGSGVAILGYFRSRQ